MSSLAVDTSCPISVGAPAVPREILTPTKQRHYKRSGSATSECVADLTKDEEVLTRNQMSKDPGTILMNPRYNKGTAFTKPERELLGLDGLLPVAVETIETQLRRCYMQFSRFTVPLSKYIYLSSLKERNEVLYYKLLSENLEEMMPYIYTPTVGQACQEYGVQFRQTEGMYFCRENRGNIRAMLDNWQCPAGHNQVDIIVVTDGSRILGLGDLGACGMGIPVGKLALYVAAGGFRPDCALPVVIDAGTNNQVMLRDDFYLGCRYPRIPDDEFYELMDEFMAAIKDKWPHALLQFEDFSNNHCFRLLETYRSTQLCFNDDIQGTGAVVAAGFLNALKVTETPPLECRILFLGAGSAGVGVADQIARALHLRFGISLDDCYARFYMLDSQGLLTQRREAKGQPPLAAFKCRYVQRGVEAQRIEAIIGPEQAKDLMAVIEAVRPTALIGLSGQAGAFTREVLRRMSELNERPVVFPLSNPTANAECSFEDAIEATNGRVVFASGSPFPPVRLPGEAEPRVASQGNNLYTFPGLGFGAWLSRARIVTDEMVTAATVTLASCTTNEHLGRGMLYPPLSEVRAVSAIIAAEVMKTAKSQNVATLHPFPQSDAELAALIQRARYEPAYVEWIN